MILEKQKLEFTGIEASYLFGRIHTFLNDEIPENYRIRTIDFLARKYLKQVEDKIWSKMQAGQNKAAPIKVSLSPEQILAVYSCIPITATGTPLSVALGKIQLKVLNYDQLINLKS